MHSTLSAIHILLAGLGFGESPRWHDGRLWFSNWGKQEIVAVDLEGKSEVMARVPTSMPFCIDWLPDGRMLVVSGPERLVLRREGWRRTKSLPGATCRTDSSPGPRIS